MEGLSIFGSNNAYLNAYKESGGVQAHNTNFLPIFIPFIYLVI